MAEGEIEYESDPEEAKLSLKMRRREASDDEEEKAKERGENRGGDKLHTRRIEDSDGESEGAVAEYYEDELYDEDEYDLEGEYVEEGDEVEYVESGGGRVGEVAVERAVSEKDAVELREEKRGVGESKNGGNSNDVSEIDAENSNVGEDGQLEEKKEVEPFAVPTAGAFYMHDDRFRDNAALRNRRMLGGRKLWESKDDRKWGHDKFEELTLQEKHHEGRRRGSRGRSRGRARNRSSDHGYADGNRSREYTNNSTQNLNNQNNPKGVRGRGSRRYPSSYKNNKEVHPTQNKQSGRSVGKTSYSSSVRTSEDAPNREGDVVPKKQAVSSSLSVASPPFYPSGTSAIDNTIPHKRDSQAGTVNQNAQPSVVDGRSTTAQSTSVMRGKNIVNHVGMDKNYHGNPLSAMTGKPSNTFQMRPSGSSSINSIQLRGQGRGITSSMQMVYQPAPSNDQLNRDPPPNQLQNFQRGPSQTHARPSVASNQYFRQVSSGTQASSPPKAAGPVNAFETGDVELPSEPSKSNTALVAKEKYSAQGNGRGSFLYGGAQVGASANMGSGRGDQNFPTFFPVMQFGGQNPGGMGVPAVGMAFPGYVGGRGNSEMTWLPVLAGAAGALGANFCPPYITVDGSYQGRTSGQVSSIDAVPSKESSAANISNDWKPGQRPELANDDSVQRQKNPRRYTEMKFDQ